MHKTTLELDHVVILCIVHLDRTNLIVNTIFVFKVRSFQVNSRFQDADFGTCLEIILNGIFYFRNITLEKFYDNTTHIYTIRELQLQDLKL